MSNIKIRREQLLKPLSAVVGVVERKHTLPILSSVLIETKNKKLRIVGTDLELQISTEIDGIDAENSVFTVSARKFLDITRSLPAEIDITLQASTDLLKINAGKSKFSLQLLPANDFPQMQLSDTEGLKFSVSADAFRDLLTKIQYAMAVQDIRYYLNGILLSINNSMLIAAATDGHRLAIDSIQLDVESTKQLDVIIPRKAVIELIKLLSDNNDPIEIQLSATQVVFKQNSFELRSKIIDGKFPDYKRVIPSGYTKTILINRQLLNQSIARAAILTNDKNKGIRVVLTENNLRIICHNNEQEEAQEDLEIEYNNEPIDIGFNVQYLLDILNNVSCETIQLSLNDSTSSLLINIPGEDNFNYVVMPMRI
jgi:DNA polymerase III subunit beta